MLASLARTTLTRVPSLNQSAVRLFAAAAGDKSAKAAAPATGGSSVPKLEDTTLEGRYAASLFAVANPKGKLDTVYRDMMMLREMLQTEKVFAMFCTVPGLQRNVREACIEDICKKSKTDDITTNFLKILCENDRLDHLPKFIEKFDEVVRFEQGLTLCRVVTATELDNGDKKRVEEALGKRLGPEHKLKLDYEVSPGMLGGLIVKVRDRVYDYSVSSRLDQLQTALLKPIE
ncbi:atp synthase [Perkinsus olseni]|uniref:Atp synthase n=1 Tax=Perkinsus olseni TaxID=32597 RepID=A0A7J6M9F6_PEROL|nr:atp synthase [Perkinsus olseni]KAF4668203.1 atp synthase [Perkinsus olseni]